jgi:hypothetical protein
MYFRDVKYAAMSQDKSNIFAGILEAIITNISDINYKCFATT